ncbi:MAG: hypothetical protein HY078_07050 [Elusimicrobia bacterium]|nr:hypothetical protein [Elusimicrobiota bacterium]
MDRLRDAYRRLFSLGEIENDRRLQVLFFCLLAIFILDFNAISYVAQSATQHHREVGQFACWPHFQSCGSWFVLKATPFGYTYHLVMMVVFSFLALSALSGALGFWTRAHALMMPPFLLKVFYSFFLAFDGETNFRYFHLTYVFVLLLLPEKKFYLKMTFCTLYFWAARIKMSGDGWIAGRYFTTLKFGLPLVPGVLVPFLTNGVVLFEMLGSWGMLTKNEQLKRWLLATWTAFHLYSVSLIGFYYPVRCIPTLWVLFWGKPEPARFRWERRFLPGAAFIAGLFLLHTVPYAIPKGDPKYTLEGFMYGAAMFDANHQCQSAVRLVDAQGKVIAQIAYKNRDSANRCDPYTYWFGVKQRLCPKEPNGRRVEWTMVHSVNGGPFYKIIDVPDLCVLTYGPLSRNAWIKTPADGAPVVGYPYPDVLIGGELLGPVPLMADTPQIIPFGAQPWLMEHAIGIGRLYQALWLLVLAAACVILTMRDESGRIILPSISRFSGKT